MRNPNTITDETILSLTKIMGQYPIEKCISDIKKFEQEAIKGEINSIASLENYYREIELEYRDFNNNIRRWVCHQPLIVNVSEYTAAGFVPANYDDLDLLTGLLAINFFSYGNVVNKRNKPKNISVQSDSDLNFEDFFKKAIENKH